MTRNLFFSIALGALAAFFAGCGEGEQIDPYTKATLREATYGEVASDGFLYKIVNPSIVDTLGNFVVARQGNLIQLITGNDIARQVGAMGDMSKLTFNVVKRFKPMVYFQCMSIVSPTDSTIVVHEKPIALPRIVDALTFTPPADYARTEMVDLRYDDTIGLRDRVGNKLSVRARLVHVETDSIPFWMLEGEKPCPSPYFRYEERLVPARLRVKQLRPTLEIVMRMIAKSDQLFDGGVTFAGVEPYPGRADNQICAIVEIGYVRFLDTVFMR